MVIRVIRRYFAVAGIAANFALLAFIGYWVSGKLAQTEWYWEYRRALLGNRDGVEIAVLPTVRPGYINPALADLPSGTWWKIHQQRPGDAVQFKRQAHGGAAFDPVRGRLILFGSDTHQKDWDNSVKFFDVGALSWSRSYQPDTPATYRVNSEGIPVAGETDERPWAMHTFDALGFDPISDQLIVASYPGHMGPDKPWGFRRPFWQKIKNHPTWLYHVQSDTWRPATGDSVHFFAHGGAFDNDRRRLLAIKGRSYWSFDIATEKWTQIASRGGPGHWANSVAYDADNNKLLSFGTNDSKNSVWSYNVGDDTGRLMLTPGDKPSGVSSPPFAYHPRQKRTVALITHQPPNGNGWTETWLYSSVQDEWVQIKSAQIPFNIGMNYNMVYDSNHDLMLLVANMSTEPVAVWALKLSEPDVGDQ